MTTKEHAIQAGKFEWFYREAKPLGEPRSLVVLLHGLVCQSYGWRHVLPALAEQGFWAIAPDWLGHGYSERPDRRDFPYSPDAFVTALAEFLQVLNINRCSLVIQGFLGTVGLQYALRHPDRVDRIAIFNAPVTTAAKLPWKMQQLGLPLAGEMITQDPLLSIAHWRVVVVIALKMPIWTFTGDPFCKPVTRGGHCSPQFKNCN